MTIKNDTICSKQTNYKKHQNGQYQIKQFKTNKLKQAVMMAMVTFFGATGLAGCQSTPSNLSSGLTADTHDAVKTMHGTTMTDANYFEKVTANTTAYQQIFDNENNPSVDVSAKNRLLAALTQHLETDHVAVSQVRHHAVPFIKEDSIDASSSSLLKTIFAAFTDGVLMGGRLDDEDYDDYENYNPYRDEYTYLEEPNALYLNYKDEKNGTLPTPDYAITREMGMAEDFVTATDETIGFINRANSCLIDYSSDMDDLFEDGSIHQDKKEVVDSKNKIKTNYQKCLQENLDDNKDVIDSAVGYQKIYLDKQDTCLSQFDTRLSNFLAAAKSAQAGNKTTDANEVNSIDTKYGYDQYDTIYQSYDVCYVQVKNLYYLEPSSYTYYGNSEKELDYTSGLVDCADQMMQAQNALAAKGITYGSDPDAYADVYYQFAACDAEAYTQVYYTSDDDLSDADLNSEDILNDDESIYDDADLNSEDILNDDESIYDDADLNSEDILNDDESIYDDADYSNDDEDYDSQSDDENSDSTKRSSASNITDRLYNWFNRTPEQIEASNIYNYQNLTFNSVSQFKATDKTVNSIYSYDFATPTMLSSLQVPISLDFKEGKVKLDPSAIMPIVAIVSPEHAPLPEDMTSTMVAFNMPDELLTQLPPKVVYDAFILALEKSMIELDSSNFTALDISNDPYAKQVGAASAIKLNLGSKQTGEMIGAIIKHMTQALDDYVKDNAEQFPDESALKKSIDKWKKLNSNYQTQDAGSILQFIEAVGPVSFNRVNYYYFDGQGKLIAKQMRSKVGGDFMGSTSSFLSQTRFDNHSFNTHPLHALFDESFGNAATPAMDGNAWIEKIKNRRYQLEQARYARYDYEREAEADEVEAENDTVDSDSTNNNNLSNNSPNNSDPTHLDTVTPDADEPDTTTSSEAISPEAEVINHEFIKIVPW